VSPDAHTPPGDATDARRPARPYRVTFIDAAGREHVVDVDTARIPYGHDGAPGSLLDIALAHGVEIDHACGGVCACATCHVILRAGRQACGEPGDREEDQLDQAYGVTPHSRLACQCVPDGSADVVVEIPVWNRNAAREK
jgi:ferredoxin, 2Fe-2S